KEVDALDAEVKRVKRSYERLLADGQRVVELRNKKDASVFKRASEVFKEWKALPDKERDKDRVVEGGGEVTHGRVFSCPTVQQAYEDWIGSEARKRVEGLAN